MGSIVPKDIASNISFYENHNSVWYANAVAIGSSTATIAALGSLTIAARTAYNTQQVAQEAAKSATLSLRDAMTAMNNAGSDILKQIKTKASIVGGNSIYALADIPAPATPGPIPAPGQPYQFKVAINADGSLDLGWKCNNPAGSQGTSYQVFRQTDGAGDFIFLGASGLKSFTDNTVPSGVGSVTYKVIAFRSTAMGAPAEFTVKFGTNGGTMTASVVAPKLAA